MDELTVRKPKVTVNDEHVQQALANLREQQGSLVPVEDRGVQEKDYLIADVDVSSDGESIAHQHDAQLISRPGRIAGVEIEDFSTRVDGMAVGEERTLEVEVPDTNSNPKIAGKTVQIKLKLKDIKALELVEIDGPFLESLGFESEQELLDALREQMVERVDADIQNAMRRQVQEFLASRTVLDLPKRLLERQVERVANRQAVNLLMRGMPREQVQANAEQIKQGAQAEAERELTLFFLLSKVAQDRNLDVSEAEVNGRVAMLALDQGERPEALRQRMEKDGSLGNLFMQLREQKALDALLAEAKIEEFEPTAEEEKQTIAAAATGEDAAEDVT
jgi:trigger factor